MLKMEEFEVFKFENMEKDLEEKHPHKVVAIHKGNVISNGDTYEEVMKNLSFKKKALPKKYYTLYTRSIKESFIHRLGPSEDAIAIVSVNGLTKKLEIVGVDLHPKLDIDCLVGRNLFGEIDAHLLGKSGRLVLDLGVREGER